MLELRSLDFVCHRFLTLKTVSMYEWLPNAIAEAERVFEEYSLGWEFRLGGKATEEDIAECERALSISLPSGYKQLVMKNNGIHLFCSKQGSSSTINTWWADSGVVLFSTKTLVEYKPLIYESFVYDDDACDEDYCSILPIAYLGRLMTGDFCAVDLSSSERLGHPVIDCNHERPPSEWKQSIIANSIDDWLRKMFENVVKRNSFPEYWIESSESESSLENFSQR